MSISDNREENVIIMGDFNMNLFMDNKQRSLFEEIVLCNGFTPTISVATHLKPNTKLSCIDNILTNNVENVLKSGVIETHISHHRSLYLALKSSLKANSAEPKVIII